MVTELIFKTGTNGKPYMKMVISDKGYDMTIYMNGKNYEKFSRTFKKYKVYMLSLVKNGRNGYVNVIAATEPENVDVDKRNETSQELCKFSHV